MATKKTTKGVSTKAKSADAKLTWLPQKTFELEITIPWADVSKAYDQALAEFTNKTEIKGFRQGKAPKAKVEEQVGKGKIFEEVTQKVVSKAYLSAVKSHNLRPIVNPQVKPVSMQNNKDWVVKVTACEFPKVKLGKYKEAVRGLKAKSNLWTPDKGDPKSEKPKDNKPGLDQLFEEILKVAEIEVADILIENETNRLVTQLVDQIQAAGMTMQQYMEAKGLTQESLQVQYKKTAENNLKVEFLLSTIAEEEKMELPLKEAEEMIAKSKDPYVKKGANDPQQKTYIAIMIRKQKVVDFLMSL
jgi:FKBP-type peptidyl-prolyl cis-trans isomerase (trigger factor)